jgi:ABC-2 type transport system permease protein
MTSMPVIVASVFSGAMMPIADLPDVLRRFTQGLPMTRVVELLRLGLTGTTADGTTVGTAATFGRAVVPLLVLAAWVVVGVWATRRWFRWEPRR